MSAYTPKRYERGAWITRVVGTRNEWQRAFWRDYIKAKYWLKRNWLALIAAIALVALSVATMRATARIYEPHQQAPFLPTISAVRG